MSGYERSLEDNYEMLKKQLTAKQQQQQQQRHQPSPSPPPPLVRSASDSSGSKPESVIGIGREIKRITIEDERKKKLQEMLRKQQHHLQQQQHQARRAQYPLAVAAQQPSQKLSRIVSRNSSSASATTTMTGGVKSTGAKSVSSSSSSSLSQPPSLMSTPTLPATSRALVSSSSSSVSHLPPPDPSDMSNRIASLLEDNDKIVDKHRRKQLAAAAVAAQKTSTHLSTFSSNAANITPSALMISRIKSKRSESADSNDLQDDHHLLGSFRSQSSSTTTSSTRSLTPTRPPAILSSQPQHHYQTTSGAASKLLLPSSSSFGSSSTSSIRSASSTTPTSRLMSSSHHHHHNHHQNHPHKVEHNYKFKRICSMALKLFGTYNTAGSSGSNSGGLVANEDEDKPVSSSSPSLASYSNDISNDVLMNVDMAAAALRYDYESMMAKAHSVAAAASSSSSRASSCAAELRSSSDSVDQDDISRLARVKSLRKIAAAVNSGAAVVASQKLTTFQPQLPIQQTLSQQQKQLTPDMAARRIQAAFRKHLARRNPQFYSGSRSQQQQQQQEASIRRIQSINQCLTKLDMNTNQHHLKSKSLSIGLELCGSGAGGIENRPIGGGSIINRSLKPLAVIAKQQQQINAQITPVSTATIRTTASITTTRGSDYFLEDFHVEKLTSTTATSGELKLPLQQPSMVKFNASRFEYDEFAPVRKLSSSIRSKSESITASALSAAVTANANHVIASKSSGSSSTSSSSLSDMATAANLMMRRKTNRMSKLDSELAEMAVKAYSLTGINASSSTSSTTTAATSAKSNLDPHEALEAVVHLQAKLAPSKLAAATTSSSSDENNLFKATAKSGTRVSAAASYSSSSSSSSSNCSSASSTSSSSSSSSHSTLNEKEMNPESSEIVTPVLLAAENASKLKALRRHQTAPQSQQIARGVLLSESRRTMSNSSDPAQIQYTDDVVSGLEEFAATTTTTASTTTPTKNGVSTNDLALDKSFRQLLLPSIEGHGKKSSSLQHRVVADALIASMNKELAAVAAADANEAINTACSSGSSTSTASSSAAAAAAAIGGFFEDDSFKKFMDELIHKFMREEETRNKHYAHMLKLREKALVEKTQRELDWLEEYKRNTQEKGEEEKMPQILSKERAIKQKLRLEQENINKMKEVQRQASESRLAMILSQHHSELVKWCQNKLKQQQQSQQTDVHTETATTATTTTSTAANNDEEIMIESSTASMSESMRKHRLKHLNPERYLTEREKKLRLRRKQAEDIISWKKKLDDEEMKVREIEKKANSMLTTPTPVKAAVESVSSPIRVVQDQIKTDLNENNESEEAKTNLEKSGRTKELETKVRELQREMIKKTSEADKLRQTLELKEKEDKIRKNRKNGSDSIVDRVDEENSSTTSVSITDVESSINSKPIVNESSPKVSQTETSDIQSSPALIEYEQSSNEVESKIEEKVVDEDINKDEVIVSGEIVIEESVKERYIYEEEEEEYDGKNSIIASQDSLAIQTTLMESSALSSSVKPISVGIHQDAEKISQLCNLLVANYYWKRLDRLKLLVVAQLEEDEMDVRDSLDFDADLREYFDEPIGLLFSSTSSSSRSSSPNNHEDDEDGEDEMNFKLMLLHLVGELMLDLYSERFEQDEQDDELDLFVSSYHIKGQRKLHFKSVLKGPSRLEEAQKLISIKVADYLLKQPPKSATVAITSETSLHPAQIHDNTSSSTSVISTRSKWHQQRRLELFDTVLNRELREQEYEWSNYEAEEYETKMLVADAIFNSILHDTIDAFQISFIKKHT